MHNTQKLLDNLQRAKTAIEEINKSGVAVNQGNLAKKLGVARCSASKYLKILAEEGQK